MQKCTYSVQHKEISSKDDALFCVFSDQTVALTNSATPQDILVNTKKKYFKYFIRIIKRLIYQSKILPEKG